MTCSDFRPKHLAAGGDGAPLVLYGDYYIFSSETENRILLNLGGVANVTYLPAGAGPSEVVGTDVGPGNTMMDAFVRAHFDGLSFDRDARFARRGTVSEGLLDALRANAFIDEDFPKTTGPELSNLEYLSGALAASGSADLSPEDQLATLNRFSAESICAAIRRLTHGQGEFHVYASGGGIHNPLLLDYIRRGLADYPVCSTDVLGIDPDAKEAVLFAILANEYVAGATGRCARRCELPAAWFVVSPLTRK